MRMPLNNETQRPSYSNRGTYKATFQKRNELIRTLRLYRQSFPSGVAGNRRQELLERDLVLGDIF